MVWFRYSVMALLGLLLNVTALAVETEDIRTKMADGGYASSDAAAGQLETAEGYALSAEILLSEVMLGLAEKNKKQSKKARELAEAGLELEPTHQNSRLQYAIADGFVTRETGDVSAWMKKLPQKTHDVVQAYRNDFPNDPRGDALLGAWHLAIARKAGNKNAQKWFDASLEEGRTFFQYALETQNDDIVIRVNYAFSLLALKEEDYPETVEAREILKAVMNIEPADNLGQVLQNYAGKALAQIDNRDAVRDYAGMFLDGKVPVFENDD